MIGVPSIDREIFEAAGGPSTNRELANSILRRRAVIEDVSDDLAGRVGSLYAAALRETTDRIAAAAARGRSPSSFSQALRGRVAGELADVVEQLMPKVGAEMGSTLRELHRIESETSVQIFRHAIPDDVLASISVVRPPAGVLDVANMQVLGTSLGRWGRKASEDLLDGLSRQIAIGSLQGDDQAMITRRTAEVFGVSRQRAELTARTAVHTVSNEAHAQLYDANLDIMNGVQALATFDRRTCPYCAGLDGQIFRVDDGSYQKRPRFPAHPHCRCVYTPVTKSWKELGANLKEIAPGSRASMNGQVPGKTSFSGWLKTQPPDVADDILGKTRADLWREGRVKLGDFVSSREGRSVPVRDLLARLDGATRGVVRKVEPPKPAAPKSAAEIRAEVMKVDDSELRAASAALDANAREIKDLWERHHKLPLGDPERDRIRQAQNELWLKRPSLEGEQLAAAAVVRKRVESVLRVDDPIEFRADKFLPPVFGKLTLKSQPKDVLRRAAAATDWLAGLVSRKTGVSSANSYIGRTPNGREFAYKETRSIHVTTKTEDRVFVHELGHQLEFQVPGVAEKARVFLAKRAAEDPRGRRPLKTIQPNRRYGRDETAWEDKFVDPYMGKYYPDGATEIVSMGVEHIWSDARSFAERDPEYFDFIVGTLRGQ